MLLCIMAAGGNYQKVFFDFLKNSTNLPTLMCSFIKTFFFSNLIMLSVFSKPIKYKASEYILYIFRSDEDDKDANVSKTKVFIIKTNSGNPQE